MPFPRLITACVAGVVTALCVVTGASAALTSADARREVIVRFDPGTTRAQRAQAVDGVDVAVERPLAALSRTRVLTLAPGETVASAMRELRSEDAVAWVQPNRRVGVAVAPPDPLFGQQWAFAGPGNTANVLAAWDERQGSSSVRVGVVDTGIAADHPDLLANLRAEDSRNFVAGPTATVDPAAWSDPNGHGTHVAGIIGAVGGNGIGVTGVNWRVGVFAARSQGLDGMGTDAGIADAMAWAADRARVVNISIAGPGPSPVEQAVIDAHPETLFVVAAGNDTADTDVTPYAPCMSTGANVICVASTDPSGALSSFSNYGATTVDLAAPGSGILSTWPTFSTYLSDPLFADLANWTQDQSGQAPPGGPWVRVDTSDPGTKAVELTDATGHSNGWQLISPTIPSLAGTACRMTFYVTEDFPDPPNPPDPQATPFQFVVGARSGGDPTPFTQVAGPFTGSTEGPYFQPFTVDLSAFDGQPDVQVMLEVDAPQGTVFGTGQSHRNFRMALPEVSCVTPPDATGSYHPDQGTSMASPMVAGAAALLLSKNPSLPVARLREALLSTVTPSAGLAGKVATGGRLNVAAALASIPAAVPPAPDAASPPSPVGAPPLATGMAPGTVITAARGGRHVVIPLACPSGAATRCRVDAVIQQRVTVRGSARWRTWGVLRGLSLPAGWHGRRSVPLNPAAQAVLARHPRARVSLAIVRRASADYSSGQEMRTPFILRGR